jgi:RNA polymerase sigma factor (sigma-70 family)
MITTPAEKERLIADNTGIVYLYARKYASVAKSAGFDVEDLVGIGLAGLSKAIDNFDPERGVKLVSYAGLRVRGDILHEIRNNRCIIRVPRNAQEQGDADPVVLSLDTPQQGNEYKGDDSFCYEVGVDDNTDNGILLRDAINKISEPNRSIFVDYFKGFTMQELADVRGVTPSAIQARIKRTLARLRNMRELSGLAA